MLPPSTWWAWAKEHPWIVLGFAVGMVLSAGVRAQTWMAGTNGRLDRLEAQAAVIAGIARVVCLKTDSWTTSAADLPCDALLHRGR